MMREKSLREFTDDLSSSKPVPGGGGACAAVGAYAAALGMMVGNLTTGKKRYAEAEEEIRECLKCLEALRDRLLNLIDQDAEAFEPLSKAYSLPKETPEQKAKKEEVMEAALYEASIVPVKIMETVLEAMRHLRVLGRKGSRIAVSDVGVGVLFAQAALEGASLNIFINTKMMKDRERAQTLDQKAEALIREGEELKREIYAEVLACVR